MSNRGSGIQYRLSISNSQLMRILVRLALVAPIFISNASEAAQFYLFVDISCDIHQKELNIFVRGYEGEEGVKQSMQMDSNSVNPNSLVTFTKYESDDSYTVSTTTFQRICKIKDATYKIEVTPYLPLGYQPEGRCATRIGAKFSVFYSKRLVAKDQVDTCYAHDPIATETKLSNGRIKSRTLVSADDFYSGNYQTKGK